MKNLFALIFIFLPVLSIAQKPFAKVIGEHFIIERDTVELKKFLKDNLFSESTKEILFDKVEIKKQKMLTSNEEYYFVLISDSKNHIRIAKWLNRIGENLYSKENLDNGDLFENLYQTCVGEQDCQQNVFTIDSKRHWTCGEQIACMTEEQANLVDCKAYKSIIPVD